MLSVTENRNSLWIKLNESVEVEFLLRGKELVGMRKVLVNGFPLRNEQECIFPELATPDGWEIDHYEYCGWEQEDDKIILYTKPWFRVAHRMEWSEHALHLRINTASWSTGPKTAEGACLQWILRPCEEVIGNRVYRGFSYGFAYSCDGYEIYQIEDKATWELGGDISANTFVMRGCCEPPVVDFSEKENYISGWIMKGIANPYIFQHSPLYTQMQGFTFQYDRSGILITKHERPSHVRSLFHRTSGSPLLLHFNQFCFDLTDHIQTPAREILFCESGEECFTDRMNHYLRAREQIAGKYRDAYGVRFDKARPDAHVETWQIARMEQFPAIFRQLHDWSIFRTFLMPLWRSNTTDVLPRFEEDKEKFGILGNMCCPLELEIAPCYGGDEGLKKALSCTKDLGIETYTWFGSHFSSVTNLERKIPELFAHDVSGQNQRNNYGHVLWAVNQNNKLYQDYLLCRFIELQKCGISGIFRDSHTNMASDTINYLHTDARTAEGTEQFTPSGRSTDIQDRICSMHDAELSIQKAFQDQGLLYYVESQGIFGTPMTGLNYNVVTGNEFLYQDMSTGMNEEDVAANGRTPYEAYFRGMAVRLFFQLHIEVNKFPAKESFDPWWEEERFVPLLRAYAEVESYMETMWLLPDGMGIRWEDNEGHCVVFTYEDGTISVPAGVSVREMTGNRETVSAGELPVGKYRIYLWKTEGE